LANFSVVYFLDPPEPEFFQCTLPKSETPSTACQLGLPHFGTTCEEDVTESSDQGSKVPANTKGEQLGQVFRTNYSSTSIHTYLLTYLPTYELTFLPTYLPTYLHSYLPSIHLLPTYLPLILPRWNILSFT
jgi:hypothetical protein